MEDPFNLPPDILGRIPLFAELQKVLSWSGGPVNWDLARQVAVSMVADQGSAAVTEAERAELSETVRLSELWLSEVASLPAAGHLAEVKAVTAVGWAEHASEWLREIVDPVAAKVTRSMGEQAGTFAGAPESGPLTQMLGQMAPVFSGLQTGAILGALAQDVTGSYEIGFPLGESEPVTIVVPTVDRIAAEHGLDQRSTRLWVALRAAAHRLAFDNAWVRAHFFSLYLDFVSTIEIDLSSGLQKLQGLNLEDPQALQEALGQEGLFETSLSEAAQRAGARIGSFLAVIEAHSTLAAEAASAKAGGLAPVAETFARRAAAGSNGTKMLAQFIGLDAEPKRPAARRFVRTAHADGGWELLNRLWEEPEAFPTETELEDPQTWIRRLER